MLLQFLFAHTAATTICTGFFLTVHNDVMNLYPKYKNIRNADVHQLLENGTNLTEKIHSMDSHSRRRRYVPGE